MEEPENSNQALLLQLQRVRSDLGFRNQIRKYIKWIVGFLVFNLIISIIAIYAFVRVRTIQQDSCEANNKFRLAYVNQWGPIIADSPPPEKPPADASQEVKDDYERQIRTRNFFIQSLDEDFAQVEC